MRKKKESMITLHKKEDYITTWDGREVLRENCRRIDGLFYEVNKDCFLVENDKGENKWFRLNTGRIAFDYNNQRWDLIKRLKEIPGLESGIVDEQGNKGYFTLNPYKNIMLLDNPSDNESNGTLCINAEIATKLGYIDCYSIGCWVKKDSLPKSYNPTKKTLYHYKNIKKLAYNADENNNTFVQVMKQFSENKNKIQLSPNTPMASKLLGNYSMGIEYESSNGTIPYNLLGPLGIIPLKDGSLRNGNGEPYEYTTIPLSGEHGLEAIKLQCEELSKRCEFDKKCSLHIHIGGVQKRTEEFVIAMYKLAYNLQDEIFDMFPEYKRTPENYVEDYHKNYCQKLPNLQLEQFDFKAKQTPAQAKVLVKQAFDKIYNFLSDYTVAETNDRFNLHTFNHPKGNMDKWHYNARYMHCNLMRFMFNRSSTIEWRLHTPSFNATKVTNWLFICVGIVRFAEKFTNEILKDEVPYTLKTIMDCYKNNFFDSFYETDYNNQVATYLTDYIEFRKSEMKKAIEKKDGWGKNIEFKNDLTFTFRSSGLESIY